MWAAQYYPYQNERQLVTSGGLGTMGFGVPAAIGAKIANPDKEVVLFVGDGGFQMTNQELAILKYLQGSNQGRYAQQPFTWDGPSMARSLL